MWKPRFLKVDKQVELQLRYGGRMYLGLLPMIVFRVFSKVFISVVIWAELRVLKSACDHLQDISRSARDSIGCDAHVWEAT